MCTSMFILSVACVYTTMLNAFYCSLCVGVQRILLSGERARDLENCLSKVKATTIYIMYTCAILSPIVECTCTCIYIYMLYNDVMRIH